jgi:hypothetical protein
VHVERALQEFFASTLEVDDMRSMMLVGSLLLAMSGCYVSHTTKEKEVPIAPSATSGAGRRCGNETCTPDQRCVEGSSGYFHCE